MAVPRILTFNFHEPYVCLMAKTGLPMDLGVYEFGHHLYRPWQFAYRPVPAGVTFLDAAEWRARIAENYYDVIIAQNETNALDIAKARCGKILVCHNRRTFLNTTVTNDPGMDPVEAFSKLLSYLQQKMAFVFISESKRGDYGVPGRVILPGIDLDEYGGYTGETPAVLRVGNTMRQRNLMFDVDFQEQVCAGLSGRVAGANPEIPGAAHAQSWDELRGLYRSHRCLLHVTREAYEDGYNLATLEAMATGMPVVSLANPTSPLTNGVDGFVSYDAAQLRGRIEELLADRDLAKAIGARGRETVAAKFPIATFTEKWREAIALAADRSTRPAWHALRRMQAAEAPAEAPRLLLHYLASPLTTARYFDDAARAHYRVTTAGFRVPEEVLAYWGFEGPPPPYGAHDVATELHGSYDEMVKALPEPPDLYLWVDSGPEEIEPGISAVQAPKAAYLIDTHVTPQLRLAMARHFDVVFLAQKAQVETFRAHGIRNIHWLPLACAPSLHAGQDGERHFDFAYVGSLSPEEHDRRRVLLEDLQERFPNSFVGRAWPEDMARIYAQSKIVVNACFNRDLNMRVFEAMASGALLITDNAAGLDELFVPGEHLIVYHDDAELPGLVQQYLADEAARTRIAVAGQALVLREHTYEKRFATLKAICEAQFGASTKVTDPSEKTNKAYYQCPREEIIPHVPLHTRRLLDVGCGQGLLASTLKRLRAMDEVAGIEIIESAWQEARKVLDTCLFGSIEEMELPFPDNHFDCIICADVLEHLVDPWDALRKLKRVLAHDGVIVISIPNVRYHEVVRMLAAGAWTYMDAGIMDSTHLRFFCGPDLHELIRDAGLEVATVQPLSILNEDRLPRNDDGSLSTGVVTYLNPTPADIEGLRVYQYLVVACKPGADRLARARAAMDAGEYEAAAALAMDAIGTPPTEQRALVAKAWAKAGKLAEAEELYAKILAEDDAPSVRADYGTLLLAMGRVADARAILERVLVEMPDADRVVAALGLADLSEGYAASAFDRFLSALSASTVHVELWAHLIPLARELGRVPEMLPVLMEHADFYPGRTELVLALCEELLAAGRVDEARERLDMLCMIEPDCAEAAALLARCGA